MAQPWECAQYHRTVHFKVVEAGNFVMYIIPQFKNPAAKEMDRTEHFRLGRNSIKWGYTRYVVYPSGTVRDEKDVAANRISSPPSFCNNGNWVTTPSLPPLLSFVSHVLSVFQLDWLVVSTSSSFPPCPKASQCRGREYVSISTCPSGEAYN